MKVSGTDEFINQAIKVGALKNLQIEFVDSAQNEKLENLKQTVRNGIEHSKQPKDTALGAEENRITEKKEDEEE